MIRWMISLLAALLIAGPATAATVTSITYNGPFANRVDVVILGDGYRAAEMAKFRTDAAAFATRLMATAPFSSYRRSFNITRVETPSVESGAGQGRAKNTVYGAYFGCFSIQRLLCVNDTKVTAMIAAHLPTTRRDMVVVLVNDAEYGGSGGRYAVASTHPLASEIMLHEIGHSFGNLDDEYVDQFNCGRYTNPWGFNVTRASTRTGVPWARWIASTTAVPTPISFTGPGVFEGAFFCATGWYRPTADSMMRTLGVPFGPVNGEQLIRRHYEIVSLVDKIVPAALSVRMPATGRLTFTVTTANGGPVTPTVTWRLAGRLIGTGPSVVVTRAALAGAPRALQATVAARPTLVRNDPRGVLTDRVTWTVSP